MSGVRNELVRLIDDALGDDPRVALGAVRELGENLVWLEQRAVVHARARDHDWGRIGRALGLTRQGARKKFSALPLAMPPIVRARDHALRQDNEVRKLRNRIGEGRYSAGVGGVEDDAPVAW